MGLDRYRCGDLNVEMGMTKLRLKSLSLSNSKYPFFTHLF